MGLSPKLQFHRMTHHLRASPSDVAPLLNNVELLALEERIVAAGLPVLGKHLRADVQS